MEDRLMQFRVGVVAFAALLVTAILVYMLGEQKGILKLFERPYTIYVVFDQAPGVSSGTTVRKSGIPIGRVAEVQFAQDRSGRQDTHVLVTVSIDHDKHVYEDETCYLQSSLLGDAKLEFVRSPTAAKSTKPIEPGAQVRGVYVPDPAHMLGTMQSQVMEALQSVSRVGSEMQEVSKALSVVMQNINGILEDNRAGVKGAVDQVTRTLASIERVADGAQQLIGDPETQRTIREQMRRLPAIVDEAQKTLQAVQNTANTFARFDQSINNINRVTGQIGSDQFLGEVQGAIHDLRASLQQLSQFSKSINESDGTLSRLINDPDLYQHLDGAVRNVESLTRQLRPIVSDARVLTDKAARNPGVFLRDAIKPGPGIK